MSSGQCQQMTTRHAAYWVSWVYGHMATACSTTMHPALLGCCRWLSTYRRLTSPWTRWAAGKSRFWHQQHLCVMQAWLARQLQHWLDSHKPGAGEAVTTRTHSLSAPPVLQPVYTPQVLGSSQQCGVRSKQRST